MGRRLIGPQHQVWSAMDTTAPAISEVTNISQSDIVKYILSVDATVVCEIAVESCDDIQRLQVWREMDFKEPLLIDGATETEYEIRLEEPQRKAVRLVVKSNTGTGNIDAWISSASVGA